MGAGASRVKSNLQTLEGNKQPSYLWLVVIFLVYLAFVVAGWVQFATIDETDADYQLALASSVVGTTGFVPFLIVPIVISLRPKAVCGGTVGRNESATTSC